MAKQYIGTKEAAKRKGVAQRTVQQWLQRGQLPGAFVVGNSWAIPVDVLDAYEPAPVGRPPERDSDSDEKA